jgi:hypothetical protein
MRNILLEALVAIVLVLALITDAKADAWTKTDTMFELSYAAVAIADAMTTADIRNHDTLEEDMPVARALLGRNPEPLPTAAYFAGTIAVHYAISRLLPKPARNLWQTSSIAFNANIVANNYQLGLRVGF